MKNHNILNTRLSRHIGFAKTKDMRRYDNYWTACECDAPPRPGLVIGTYNRVVASILATLAPAPKETE